MTEQEREQERADARAGALIQTAKYTDNTAQEVISVTRDKVELALRRNLPRYVPGGQLLGSLGLAVALLTTLLTAQFGMVFGIPPETWRGFFILAFLGAVVAVVVDAVKWLRRPSIDDLVSSIEKDARQVRRNDR